MAASIFRVDGSDSRFEPSPWAVDDREVWYLVSGWLDVDRAGASRQDVVMVVQGHGCCGVEIAKSVGCVRASFGLGRNVAEFGVAYEKMGGEG